MWRVGSTVTGVALELVSTEAGRGPCPYEHWEEGSSVSALGRVWGSSVRSCADSHGEPSLVIRLSRREGGSFFQARAALTGE